MHIIIDACWFFFLYTSSLSKGVTAPVESELTYYQILRDKKLGLTVNGGQNPQPKKTDSNLI